MRATGGVEFGAISTRSYPRSCACASARCVGTTPSCSLFGPIRRTAGTRMLSLIRSSGAAIRGLRAERGAAVPDREGRAKRAPGGLYARLRYEQRGSPPVNELNSEQDITGPAAH